MAAIVWAACVSHTAAMLRVPPQGEDAARAARVFAAFESLHASLAAARPDALVIVGNDHFETFSYEAMPILAIGQGREFPTWGEYGAPRTTHRGHESLGEAVHAHVVEAGFDVVSAAEMKLDHAFSVPLGFVLKTLAVPVLPVFVNCTVPPLATLARVHAFGLALGRALRMQHACERIAVLGTGGLSHEVGTPRTGLIDERFDRAVLEHFENGRLAELARWNSDRILAESGNAAGEIRNWLVAASAASAPRGRTLAYEPVDTWKTGIAAVALEVA